MGFFWEVTSGNVTRSQHDACFNVGYIPMRQSMEALGHKIRTFRVKVDSDPELDSRKALQGRHAVFLNAPDNVPANQLFCTDQW